MSKSLLSLFFKKSQRERIALAALYKRVAVRKLLSPLFKKSNVSDSFVIRLWFEGIALKKRVIRSKKYVFFICFPTFMPKSDLLSSLLTKDKERPWGNHSQRSLQKSDHERLAPFAHDKRETGAICSFLQANRSLAYKNQVIC